LDVIRLLDIVLRGHHGVSAAEQEAGQKLEIDVELEADLAVAAREDSLASTVDYREIYGVVERTVTGRSFRLLEALAEQVAADLLEAFPAGRARVKIRKANVGVSGNLRCFEVEVERTRS
jgi:dihydroneopterin aldolase